MKYAIKFYRGCRVMDKADEIIIKYKEKSSNLIDFVQKWNDEQRIIIDITELDNVGKNLDIFSAAMSKHKKIALMLSYFQKDILVDISEINIDYFFKEGVDSLDTLDDMITLGVSDIYIVNELGFNLVDISELCKKNNVSIRVYPNVSQSSSNKGDLKSFFIRPDDIDLYEGFVDVFEFYSPLDKQAVLYEIYTDKNWPNDLSLLITGLTKEIDSRTIVPYFGSSRVGCGKRCIYGRCNLCETIEDFAKVLKEKELGLRLKKEKRKYEYSANEEDMSNESASTYEDIK